MNVNTKLRQPEKSKVGSLSTISRPQRQATPLRIEIVPKTVLAILLFCIFLLLLANLAAIFVKLYVQYDDIYRLTGLFIFNDETNIPTFYSSLAIFLCSVLLAIIAAAHKRSGSSHLPWYGLSVIFLYLSIDEAASIHERLTIPYREMLNASGYFYFAWVIPYGLATVLFCALYGWFLIRLPKKTMSLFLASGATFVSGALGLEMVGAFWAQSNGTKDLIYLLMVTFEELLEILGIVIFVYALFQYISERFGKFEVTAGVEEPIVNIDFSL